MLACFIRFVPLNSISLCRVHVCSHKQAVWGCLRFPRMFIHVPSCRFLHLCLAALCYPSDTSPGCLNCALQYCYSYRLMLWDYAPERGEALRT